jgi:hypothetical protein
LCGGTLWADSQRLGTQGPQGQLRCAGVHCGQTVRGWVPRVHSAPAPRPVRTATVKKSAHTPLVIHFFSPVTE